MTEEKIREVIQASSELGTATLSAGDLTKILQRWSQGEPEALDDLFPMVYGDLLRIARLQLKGERENHTLEATALVHEVFLRLTGGEKVDWQDRTHFFRLVASLMRRTLVDHARGRVRQKRGGQNQERIPLSALAPVSRSEPEHVLAVSEALEELEKMDALKAQIVELRFFGGFTVDETAECVGVSERSVARHWHRAKLLLYHRLKTADQHAT